MKEPLYLRLRCSVENNLGRAQLSTAASPHPRIPKSPALRLSRQIVTNPYFRGPLKSQLQPRSALESSLPLLKRNTPTSSGFKRSPRKLPKADIRSRSPKSRYHFDNSGVRHFWTPVIIIHLLYPEPIQSTIPFHARVSVKLLKLRNFCPR